MKSVADFDESKFYLGRLCKRGHDYLGTGQSLRYKRRACVECSLEAAYRQDDRRKDEKRCTRFANLPTCPYPKPEFDSSRFYLGKLCSRAHAFCEGLSLRQVSDRSCQQCKKEAFQKRKIEKPEQIKQEHRRYYLANREKIAEYCRNRYIQKREHCRQLGIKYRQENKDKEKLRCQRYRQSSAGKESGARSVHKRRVRKLAGHHSPWSTAQLRERYQEFECQCAYCGSTSRLTMDHFIPLSQGGSDCLGNLIPACKPCNSSKHNRDALEWYKLQSFFSRKRWNKILRIVGRPTVDGQIPLF